MTDTTESQRQRYERAVQEAAEFNERHKPGSLVKYWPWTLDEPPKRSVTRGQAWALLSGEAVVRVEGYPGGIALDHVVVVPEEPDPYASGWECDEQGEWKPCYAPGCTHNRRRSAGEGSTSDG